MIVIIPALIIPILAGIFFLCDDHKEIIQAVRQNKREIILTTIPVIIFLGYPIFLYTVAIPADNLIWNIYNFCGMPGYALPRGSFYTWWNLIYVFVDTTKRIFFYFPLGGFALLFMIWYTWRKPTIGTYILLLTVEFIVLFVAFGISLQ